MTMREGERWICSNSKCKCEIQVVISARTANGTNPQCSCGCRMRKAYTAPTFRRVLLPEEVKVFQEKFFSSVR